MKRRIQRRAPAFLLILAAGAGLVFPPLAFGAGARISAQFTLTQEDLRGMTASLPAPIQDGILARSRDFLQLAAKVLDEPEDYFLLVDKRHPLPADYTPQELVRLFKDYKLEISWTDVSVRKAIMPALIEMARAARRDGVTLTFSSGYRSYEYQISVYQREVKMYGKEKADRESAQAGMSQHQLGTAIDFGSITDAFADTRAGKWLVAHGGEYGFSLSYPRGYEDVTGYRYESWHYRYITRSGTLLQREFFHDVQQYLLEFLHENRATLQSTRSFGN